ncbi:hypothetical protein AVEN_268423-1 [Araneus ventricosus]|uniref:Uncharacterized protein n=1 Tax=Araneus ventricosus TaxID=182803 RepID=A0A4Y2DVS4_ARAVE|nr:hypothetical protein AVEN_268423-1 [Araneus ventricosus]
MDYREWISYSELQSDGRKKLEMTPPFPNIHYDRKDKRCLYKIKVFHLSSYNGTGFEPVSLGSAFCGPSWLLRRLIMKTCPNI